ncbi:flowering time control protein FCA isoform X2 [Nymphaea colorata]|uniref:flowering time control protein FCA isoform X2 n=1 Tax=Nymphaea colorata TaxID=210225 RepID=UPI00129E958C|nr:flowering time control protein FCA isoform X2 [Nymphaea colorata]
MDRHRGDRSSGNHDGGRGGRHHHSRMSSRSSSGHHDYPNQRQPFSRGGGGGGGGPSGGHRYPPNNFPMHHSGGGGGGGGGGGRSGGGGGNMRQGSGYGGSPQPPYLSGHKRPSSGFSSPSGGGGGFSRRGSSPDSTDTGTFAKLFVGSVPRTAREEEIRPLFEEHGNVLEVALIKDKRTGQQQGCCFVKYATSEEADRAIRALHNQCTLPGGLGPIQVRYADGERERLAEYKLFVGSLNKQATEKEIEEIFSPYGRVEDVYIMRDDLKQSRGCGFVKFSYREMAAAAIDALNGKYMMRGCDQPLTVRFADPKRPKTGDSRSGPAFGGPGFGQRSQLPPMNRSGYDYPIPTPNAGGNMGIRMPPNSWHPMSPENFGMHSSQVNSNVIGGHPGVRGGAGAASSATAGAMGLGVLGAGGPPNGSLLGPAVAPIPSSQQGLNMPLMQAQPFGQPLSPSKKSLPSPQHLPSSLQHQQQTSSYAQGQTPLTSVQFSQQLQTPLLMNQQAFGQRPPPQHLFSLNNQLSSSQPQIHQMTPALQQIPSSSQLQSGPVSVPHAQLALVANQMPQLQVQPSPGHQQQLMLQQQAQASQLSFQSPQHAYSQLQQQLHMVQSTSQSQSQPISQPHKQQTSWADVVPQTVASTPATTAVIASSNAMVPVIPVSSKTESPVTCNWTEHTSPEGYKYYYNSVTRESRWEKPEELIAFEQKQQQQQPQQHQQQMPPSQHLQAQTQAQLQSQLQSPQQVSQSQQQQPAQGQQQLQVQHQQPGLSTLYQTTGVLGSQNIQGLSYMQLQGAGSTIDPSRLQQAVAAQEWMWKNKPTGN